MKTLGLIGGTSWHSTIDYYRYINALVGEKIGTHVNPPLLIYSQNVELMRRGDWDEINETYLATCLKLQTAGAEAIMICANTPHKVVPFVAPHLDIPFIHIADATGTEARRLGIDTLGLLGTKYVMGEAFITEHLRTHHELQTEVPEAASITRIHNIIADELTQGIFTEETKQVLIGEMNVLRGAGAKGMILGCTELPMILKPGDYDLPMFDTTYLHAKMAVEFILG